MAERIIKVALIGVDAETTNKIKHWLNTANSSNFAFTAVPHLCGNRSDWQAGKYDLLIVDVTRQAQPCRDLLSNMPLLAKIAPVIVLACPETAAPATELLTSGRGDVLLKDKLTQVDLLRSFKFGLQCREVCTCAADAVKAGKLRVRERCHGLVNRIDTMLAQLDMASSRAPVAMK